MTIPVAVTAATWVSIDAALAGEPVSLTRMRAAGRDRRSRGVDLSWRFDTVFGLGRVRYWARALCQRMNPEGIVSKRRDLATAPAPHATG